VRGAPGLNTAARPGLPLSPRKTPPVPLWNRLLLWLLPLLPRAFVRWVAGPYIAGETRAEAVETVAALNRDGAVATVDVLGEDATVPAHIDSAVAEYRALVDAIVAEGLKATVSVKLTQLGLRLDRGECERALESIVGHAATACEGGVFVTIDMEDHTVTEATLAIYAAVRAKYANVGPVLQAYLFRTPGDIDRIVSTPVTVRLCKGIYVEPADVAWKDTEAIRESYRAALEKLLRLGANVGIATHDEQLLAWVLPFLARVRTARDRYEFQMLLGVTPGLRQMLLRRGEQVRVYVPYGRDWYAYSLRRLRENPAIAGHVTRQFFARFIG
jgi:proline dehydrogenase